MDIKAGNFMDELPRRRHRGSSKPHGIYPPLIAKAAERPGQWMAAREVNTTSAQQTLAFLRRRYGVDAASRAIGKGRSMIFIRVPKEEAP